MLLEIPRGAVALEQEFEERLVLQTALLHPRAEAVVAVEPVHGAVQDVVMPSQRPQQLVVPPQAAEGEVKPQVARGGQGDVAVF